MTEEQISKLKGRKLDLLIANKVFGCKCYKADRYSTDISAAWKIVEKLWSEGYGLWGVSRLFRSNYGQYSCKFECNRQLDAPACNNWRGRGIAETAPLAICRAALNVKTCFGEKA